ncbi:hypothetical protein ABZ684_27910 [Streptomyces sp. NPDC006995]|uniref:hypothetical protein n=1 Tax=Streptomyces sp. NPDC006995 TaxID=3156907 RepID=UPI00340400DE
MGELETTSERSAGREWTGDRGCRTWVAVRDRTTAKGEQGMAEASRHWDGAGLERKIRAAGRPWTVGDIAMVADGQWGVGAQPDRWPDEETVERRVAEGRRVELTMEELARAVGPQAEEGHRDENRS